MTYKELQECLKRHPECFRSSNEKLKEFEEKVYLLEKNKQNKA